MKFVKGNLVRNKAGRTPSAYFSYRVLTDIDILIGYYISYNKGVETYNYLDECEEVSPKSFGLKRGYCKTFSNKHHTKLIAKEKFLHLTNPLTCLYSENSRIKLNIRKKGINYNITAYLLGGQNNAVYTVHDIHGNVFYYRSKVYKFEGTWYTYNY